MWAGDSPAEIQYITRISCLGAQDLKALAGLPALLLVIIRSIQVGFHLLRYMILNLNRIDQR